MIGVDWGTTGFRAYRIGPDGAIRDRKSGPLGILSVQDNRFAESLRAEIGPWLALGETRVLLSGMIGSRQGWCEAPYLPLPADAAALAAGAIPVPFDWASARIVPGLSGTDAAGTAEVMRGEETQILGADLPTDAVACLPGTHSKWARVAGGRIAAFSTHMTGEMFAALRGNTILGRTMRDGAPDGPWFDAGVRRSGDAGGVAHHAFGVRAEHLAGRLPEDAGPAYLSGILVGHEVRAELGPEPVHLIGAAGLTGLYARAIELCGGSAVVLDPDAAARGLARIGAAVDWG